MHEQLDITTVIFAIIAIFVIWKLRSVLGERNGTEKPPRNPFGSLRDPARPHPAEETNNNVIKLPLQINEPRIQTRPDMDERWKVNLKPGSNALAGIQAIAAADRSFDIDHFMSGAKLAYEMIVSAFAAGNRAALEGLLTQDVYENFVQVLNAREKRGEVVKTTLVSLDRVLIDEASLTGRSALIKLQFIANLITATYDANGKVIDGDAERAVEIDDRWSFTREIDSRSPNWKLCATQTGH